MILIFNSFSSYSSALNAVLITKGSSKNVPIKLNMAKTSIKILRWCNSFFLFLIRINIKTEFDIVDAINKETQ